MYKYQSRQTSVSDFNMPLGLHLDAENRWVKKARTIPWVAIERRYAELFRSGKGNVAKPLRLALGALIIQTERGISDEETALQIQETPCLQYFCGFPGYTESSPFDPSLMVHFRKRLTPEILGEINEMVIARAAASLEKEEEARPPEGGSGSPPENKGDLIVDATCAPQNIRYPQDTSLLNEARENLETIIDKLHRPRDGAKPRTYRENARRDYLRFAKRRKHTSGDIRKAVGKQLRYIRRDLGIIDKYFAVPGRALPEKYAGRLAVIRTLYGQQLHMHNCRTHQTENRIVSLGQPWVRPIVRGKAKAKCEFGAKLDISVSGGFTRQERTSFDAYNEGGNLVGIIERYKTRTGHYPERVLADTVYRSKENLKYCREKKIHVSGKPLGRPKKNLAPDKERLRREEIERIEVERKFSHAKGSFGLGLIRARLEQTSKSAIALAIIALNIAYAMRVLPERFWKCIDILFRKINLFNITKNVAFVQ